MKKTVLITFVLLVNLTCQAQFIDNKYNIYLITATGSFKGEEMGNESSFKSPSLFNNYNKLKGFSLKVLETTNYVDVGVGIDYLKASDWEYLKFKNYVSTKTQVYSISPILRIHNVKRDLGFNNRFTLFIEISPAIGFAKMSPDLKDPHYGKNIIINEVKGYVIGIKGSAGIEMIISQRMGVSLAFSREQETISNFDENTCTYSMLNLGVFFRAKPNKNYFN